MPQPDVSEPDVSEHGLLAAMLLIREFERQLMARDDHGFQLLSSGEEAVAVGLCAALGPEDQLLCSGRSIGPALARGLDPGAVLAELLGKEAGPCHGRGGRGHLAQPSAGFFGAHAVVGGNISVAAGVALAFQVERRPGLVACVFGDGACGAGALHETMNIAALWRLPLLFVCDNNGYSVATPVAAMLAPASLSDLAKPFGMPGMTVDGMDVRAVRDAALALAARVRAGRGPAFLECISGRWFPHSTATRETRGAEELADLHERCPIRRHAADLLAQGMGAEAFEALKLQAEQRVAAAFAFADAACVPQAADVLRDVG